ncbi:MAG: hypothetical protein WAV05_00785 [Anaerolineales bacterium]
MEIYFSKRRIMIIVLAILLITEAILVILKYSNGSLARAIGFDSVRGAAVAGVEAFYSVDYHESLDKWAARLCALSTEPICGFYQNTVASFLQPDFEASQSVITAKAGETVLLADEIDATRENAPMQIWQVGVSLSAPWPQGDGQASFPAYVLVVKEESGWKFERFLLADELAKYIGGKQ